MCKVLLGKIFNISLYLYGFIIQPRPLFFLEEFKSDSEVIVHPILLAKLYLPKYSCISTWNFKCIVLSSFLPSTLPIEIKGFVDKFSLHVNTPSTNRWSSYTSLVFLHKVWQSSGNHDKFKTYLKLYHKKLFEVVRVRTMLPLKCCKFQMFHSCHSLSEGSTEFLLPHNDPLPHLLHRIYCTYVKTICST